MALLRGRRRRRARRSPRGVLGWLEPSRRLRAAGARDALVATVRERWSWQGVARGVIAAASGELEALREP